MQAHRAPAGSFRLRIASCAGGRFVREISGMISETMRVLPLEDAAVDFTAAYPSHSLTHQHEEVYVDYGCMETARYAD